MDFKKIINRISGAWYFFFAVVLVYVVLSILKIEVFLESSVFFGEIIVKVIPVIIIVYVLMTLTNYFITPEIIKKHLRTKGAKKWIFMIVGGVLSTGPIYMWYPLLADLSKKGLSHGLIACFIYNRAIKIPILPVAVLYFNLTYIIILCFVMIIMSVFQGLIINKLMET